MSFSKKEYNHHVMYGRVDGTERAKRTQKKNKEAFDKSYYGQMLIDNPCLAKKF